MRDATGSKRESPPVPHIGTLNEKPLHAALRSWCSEDGDLFEVPIEGFVADILRGDLVIEIQTGSTSSLKRKLRALMKRRRVRLVLPVPVRRTIVQTDAEGHQERVRLSPRRGDVYDVFRELVSLHELLGDSNLTIDVALIHDEEVRRPRVTRRRRDWTVHERRLVEVLDCLSFHHPADYLAVVPADLAEPFTTAQLAASIGRPRWMAQKIVYVLRGMSVVSVVGKEGNAFLYARNVQASGDCPIHD